VRDTHLGDPTDTLGVAFSRGEAELADVYRAHGSLVYAICRKALGEHGASEVTQDVFVAAWRKRTQFDPGRGSLGAWLAGITKRKVIDHVRRERRHSDRRADTTPDALPDGLAVPPSDLERVADRLQVAHALSTLPDRQRNMIGLAYVEGLTHTEIAERTGLPLGTIKSDIRRGLLALRDRTRSSDE
jgi:RNA polymerase sigma-70 factor (ECF subfamily)